MSVTTLVAPELEEALEPREDSEHPLSHSGNGSLQSTLPESSDSEIQKLNEQELKAAIKSAWKKHERLAKKDMAPLLYWLRVRLRAPGSRNDIHDKDRGFAAWVEDNLEISLSTAIRWTDGYARQNGLIQQDLTSCHLPRGCKDPDFYRKKLAKRGKGFTLWVSEPLHKQYVQALKTIKRHFNITDNGEAVVKGLSYAAETIAVASTSRVGKRKTAK